MKRFHSFLFSAMLTVSNCARTAWSKRAMDVCAVEALDGIVIAQVPCVLLSLAAELRMRLDENGEEQQGSGCSGNVGGRMAQCI
jgi:hypothetical protein